MSKDEGKVEEDVGECRQCSEKKSCVFFKKKKQKQNGFAIP